MSWKTVLVWQLLFIFELFIVSVFLTATVGTMRKEFERSFETCLRTYFRLKVEFLRGLLPGDPEKTQIVPQQKSRLEN